MIKIVIAFLFVSAVLNFNSLSVLQKEIGILFGDKNATVKLQLVYDPICDNTADFDQKLIKVMDELTQEERKMIAINYIVFPLPYHMAAHKIVQGIIYVLQKKGKKAALQLMREFLATKHEWSEMKVREQSIEYLTKRISQRINKMFNLSVQKTMKALRFGSKADKKVRQWSKLTMGVIKASGTPKMSINRVPIDNTMFITTQQLRMKIYEMLRYAKDSEDIDEG